MTKEVLTRAKLAEILAEKHGLTKKASKTIVDEVLGIISEEMHSGTPVRFIGFGSFKQVTRKARKGRDPKTELCRPRTAKLRGLLLLDEE